MMFGAIAVTVISVGTRQLINIYDIAVGFNAYDLTKIVWVV